MVLPDDATETELAELAAEQRAIAVYAEQQRLAAAERALPGFKYWTIRYIYPPGVTYPRGAVIDQGAYADRPLAHLNAQLNRQLSAEVRPVYGENA
jgi:hypothetical protein